MISIFLKHPIHLKWYEFFWNLLYISNAINFSETTYTSQMLSIFLKHPIHLKWYQYFWNILYISNDMNFSETSYTSQMLSIFLKHPIHLKWYQYFWNILYISNAIYFSENILYISSDINISETSCISQVISIFLKHPVYLKWYQYFWNILYISNDINISETSRISQMISIFLKHHYAYMCIKRRNNWLITNIRMSFQLKIIYRREKKTNKIYSVTLTLVLKEEIIDRQQRLSILFLLKLIH